MCNVPDCHKPIRSRGLCEAHRSEWYRLGMPLDFHGADVRTSRERLTDACLNGHIQALFDQGQKIADIAKEYRIDLRTARGIIRACDGKSLFLPESEKPRKLDKPRSIRNREKGYTLGPYQPHYDPMKMLALATKWTK